MTDDIVTRLREYDFMRDGDTPDLTMAEAADKIERLRSELVRVLKPKDIWHDCSRCMGHEPSDNA